MSVSVRPLSHALGAEIVGVDLAKPLSNVQFDRINRTFLEKGILLFRDQAITREQHIAFSRRFGELDNHGSLPRDRHPAGGPSRAVTRWRARRPSSLLSSTPSAGVTKPSCAIRE